MIVGIENMSLADLKQLLQKKSFKLRSDRFKLAKAKREHSILSKEVTDALNEVKTTSDELREIIAHPRIAPIVSQLS